MSRKRSGPASAGPLAIVYRAVADLLEYEGNPRQHSDYQVDLIAASIHEFGFLAPVLVDGAGVLIAGHGRIMAARQVGLEEVPTVCADHLTPDQVRAYRLADNRLTELGTWSEELLAVEMRALLEADFDVGLTGWDDDDVSALLAQEDGPGDKPRDPVEPGEPPAEPITRPGTLWQLGPHRLLCGDATDEAAVAVLLEGAAPNLMVTDPPRYTAYGQAYDAEWRDDLDQPEGDGPDLGRAVGRVQNDDRADWSAAYGLFPGDVAYVWQASLELDTAYPAIRAAGFDVRSLIVWNKSKIPPSRGHYHWAHEPCVYAVRRGQSAHWAGDRKQKTVWEDIRTTGKSETGHSAQKPLECMERPIRNHRGDVFDPFVGSGTTILAAERQGRSCWALEIDPAYCDVAVDRWQQTTGGKAVRLNIR